MATLKILVFGDVFGRPGRRALAQLLPSLREHHAPDLILANVENLSHGSGVSVRTLDELDALGIGGYTSGNHIYDKSEAGPLLENPGRHLIRPLNFIDGPGSGAMELTIGTARILVINLIGTKYMRAEYANPFAAVDAYLATITPADYAAILVDMHAETTSEKIAMGYHLDGRISALWGTHTHVPTADSRILAGGTAYLTDVGMTGALDGVIGMERTGIIEKFLANGDAPRPDIADTPAVQVHGWLLEIDPATRRATAATSIHHSSILTT